MHPPNPQPGDRLVYLDWVRIVAFGLLVLYHVGMYYVSWDWHVKSPHAGPALEPLMRLVSPWRMDLLFLVSGAATASMLRRTGASSALLGARARRLLLPLLFGMLVVVPPQSYLEVVQRHGYMGSYLDFLRLYLTGYDGFCRAGGSCLILPTWNHLWFLPYLFTYTLLAWLLLRRWPQLLHALARRLPRILHGWRLFVAPVLLLAATMLLLRPHFPVTHALVDDLFAHVQYAAMFVLGLALVHAPALQQRLQLARWPALAAALAAWALLVSGSLPAAGAEALADAARALAFSVVQWCGIVAALGFARRHLGRDGPARRYLTDAVFPVYILHQTITIVLARALAPAQLAPPLEGALLVAATFAASLAGYECVRRIRWARPLFGLKAEAVRRDPGSPNAAASVAADGAASLAAPPAARPMSGPVDR
ncbi:MAG: acyltransferase family protein [Burkholderiales bacterium]|nr:acyltransferase family protein [Burkholderiales bacterium]